MENKGNNNNNVRCSFFATFYYPLTLLVGGCVGISGAAVLWTNYESRIEFEENCPKHEECVQYLSNLQQRLDSDNGICVLLYEDMTKTRPTLIPISRSRQIMWEERTLRESDPLLYKLFDYLYDKECL